MTPCVCATCPVCLATPYEKPNALTSYNTLTRAREWWHSATGLTGQAAIGRMHLGWVLETLYAMRTRHLAEVAALRAKETPEQSSKLDAEADRAW